VLISLYYSNIRFIRRIFGGEKFGGKVSYRRRLGGPVFTDRQANTGHTIRVLAVTNNCDKRKYTPHGNDVDVILRRASIIVVQYHYHQALRERSGQLQMHPAKPTTM